MLMTLFQSEVDEGHKWQLCITLKAELLAKSDEALLHQERRRRLYVQLRELQVKKHMRRVKVLGGRSCTTAQEIARALKEFWSGIMRETRNAVQGCPDWMEQLWLPYRIKQALPKFIQI